MNESTMTLMFLCVIYGMSIVGIFFLLSLMLDSENRQGWKIVLYSFIASILSPLTIIVFLLYLILEYLCEKYFLISDVCGVLKVWLGFRGDATPSRQEVEETYKIISEGREKYRFRVNDEYAKKMFYRYWRVS